MSRWTTNDIPPQRGRSVVVTGTGGLGFQDALALARAGAEVIIAGRNPSKGAAAVAAIRKEVSNADVCFEAVDLASLSSIAAFGERLRADRTSLDLLINNAAVMTPPRRKVTADGFELQFGTNFLGPFALTALLMPALERAESPRVTTVSSGAANMGMKRINFDDLQWETTYAPWKAYCQSKLADLMFSLELGRRCAAAGIRLLSNAAHPGYARTNLQTSGPGRPQNRLEKIMASFMSHDAAHGALPTLRAATALDVASGSYVAPSRLFQLKGEPVLVQVPKPARDETAARTLWEVSRKLTGVAFAGLS